MANIKKEQESIKGEDYCWAAMSSKGKKGIGL